uniref:Uncharacterized protein n=1 Tax=Arsenophonus nasoniae TaxID=638 RepID=D2U486_9GAMM|nr:hypothetical protein ARN_34980 [Arsenophonus nasoniae]
MSIFTFSFNHLFNKINTNYPMIISGNVNERSWKTFGSRKIMVVHNNFLKIENYFNNSFIPQAKLPLFAKIFLPIWNIVKKI